MKYLVILIMVLSCGKKQDELYRKGYPEIKETNSVFYPYINSFEKDFGVAVSVPIVFENISTNFAGTCSRWQNGYREIQISKIHWIFFSEAQRESLIYHELGHCVLDESHNDNSSKTGCPESIMRSYMMTSWEADHCYIQNRNYYIEEMVKSKGS